MSDRLTQAAWGACDSDHTEQNTRQIGQKVQPATIARACEAADAVTGSQAPNKSPPGGDGGLFYDDRRRIIDDGDQHKVPTKFWPTLSHLERRFTCRSPTSNPARGRYRDMAAVALDARRRYRRAGQYCRAKIHRLAADQLSPRARGCGPALKYSGGFFVSGCDKLRTRVQGKRWHSGHQEMSLRSQSSGITLLNIPG
jgi:hypothetical protein